MSVVSPVHVQMCAFNLCSHYQECYKKQAHSPARTPYTGIPYRCSLLYKDVQRQGQEMQFLLLALIVHVCFVTEQDCYFCLMKRKEKNSWISMGPNMDLSVALFGIPHILLVTSTQML